MQKTLFIAFSFLFLIHSVAYSQQCCCCGPKVELIFPGFDFEFDPQPPIDGCIVYCGGSMNAWIVTQNCVDHCGPLHASMGLGNPNGATNFCDLNNTNNSPGGPGTMQYILTGLNPGCDHIIEWWYCKAQISTHIVANCKIANGAWLDVTWEATTVGYQSWLKKSYTFKALATTAVLQFSDAGSTSAWPSGMLIDDIRMFGCSGMDDQDPVINNPPQNLQVQCIEDIPKAAPLDLSDNCDSDLVVVFKETTQNISPCKKITREWNIVDDCGNSTFLQQTIDVIDQTPPTITNIPIDITVGCDKDIPLVPKLVISDNCKIIPKIDFRENTQVIDPCTKKVSRDWTITDACGNTANHVQTIDVIDKTPLVKNPPTSIEVECDKDIPKAPTLEITDDCSVKPKVTFTETVELIDACTKNIKREWVIIDACGNTIIENQVIVVSDKTPPEFTETFENKIINCNKNIIKEFTDWIDEIGYSIKYDSCHPATWHADYNHLPKNSCDTVIVEITARDFCGQETSQIATFIVIDTIAPKFDVRAISKNYVCVPNTRDSLRNWLSIFGNSKVSTDCDTVILSSNFNGDSTLNPLQLTFYAQDRCGHIDSCFASFSYRSSNDTLRVKNYSCTNSQNSFDTIAFNINGCDSIVIQENIRLYPDSTYIKINTCDPLHKSFDTIALLNVSGCDSLIYNEYVLRPTPITNLQILDCMFSQYSKDTVRYLGQFCDSLVITEYIPLRNDNISLLLNTCDKTKEDTVIQNLKNSLGCDSIVTIYTIYTPQQMTFLEEKVCNLNNAFTDTVKIILASCDSLVITTHTPVSSDTSYIQSATCDKTKAGSFSKLLNNQYGCDSLIFEEISLSPSDSIFISNSTCSFSKAGIAIQKLVNRFGCDSIVKTYTNFIPSDTIRILQNTCILSEAGKKILFYNGITCDSVVEITTILIPPDTTNISQTTCDLNAAGQNTVTLKGSICDSVIITSTVFVPSDTTRITKTTCNPLNAGLSTIALQNSKGCDSLILINTTYVPLHLNFDLDSISCFDLNDGKFRILNASDFGAPYELILNNTNLGSQNQIDNLGPGTYQIFIRDSKGCLTDSVQFKFDNPDDLRIDLGNDLIVKKGTSINLNLQSNRTLQNIFWTPSNLTHCTNCYKINFIADQDTWIFTQAIDERGCIQTDSILIRVKESGSVYVPNVFTPNGDNINDYFFIQGEDGAVVETLFIYDRWGEKVFETHDVLVNVQTAGWNGTFNSQKMNPAVFAYYAKVRLVDQEVVELKGDVTLIR